MGGDPKVDREPSFLTPSSAEGVARETEIMLMRSMAKALDNMATELASHREAMAAMREDIILIKERQRSAAEVKEDLDALKAEVEKLKARNTAQDGAYSLFTAAKDFGPWIISLAVLWWGLFSRGPK